MRAAFFQLRAISMNVGQRDSACDNRRRDLMDGRFFRISDRGFDLCDVCIASFWRKIFNSKFSS